jgi:hypothetical protein
METQLQMQEHLRVERKAQVGEKAVEKQRHET